MAKRKKNKSLAIREHFEQFPNDKPAAISAALKSKGIVAKPTYISLVLTKLRKAPAASAGAESAVGGSQGKKKRGRPAGSSKKKVAAKSTSGSFGFEELKLARQLVDQMGDAGSAKQLIDALV